MAKYTGWKPALTAALSKVGETIAVEQITLTAPLAYTLPTGLPSGVVHSTVFTQNNIGGHTVTYGPDTLAIDTDPGASTLVEIWPGGKVTYPGAVGSGGGATVTFTTLTTTAQAIALPAATQGAQLIVVLTQDATGGRSADWPAEVIWEGDATPSVPAGPSERAVFTLLGTAEATWLGFLSGMFAAPAVPDTTDPTPGTLAGSPVTSSSFRLTISGAGDDTALDPLPYRFSTDNGGTWGAWQVDPVADFTGLTDTTGYTCVHEVRDAAGNTALGASIVITTLAASAPGITDSFNRANNATSLGVTDTGETWEQIGTGIVGVTGNTAYRATSNGFAVVDFGRADMHVSVKIVTASDFFAGCQARVVDANNFYGVDTGSGGGVTAKAVRFIGGAQANVVGVATYTIAPGDTVGISCKEEGGSTRVKLFVNGAVRGSALDSTAGRPMGTKAGIRPNNNASTRLDDFSVVAPA